LQNVPDEQKGFREVVNGGADRIKEKDYVANRGSFGVKTKIGGSLGATVGP